MHRTQIMLETRQYEALKARARREDKSLSAMIRLAVDRLLGYPSRTSAGAHKLSDICGIFKDPGGPTGEQHDEVLYGWKK